EQRLRYLCVVRDAPAAAIERRDLPVAAGIDPFIRGIEEAAFECDDAAVVRLGRGDHAVEIAGEARIEIALHRAAIDAGEKEAADGEPKYRPHCRRGDEARGERIKPWHDPRQRRPKSRGYSQGRAPSE